MEVFNRHNALDYLVKRFQNGDEEALKVLIRRFHPVLIRVIARQIREPGQAEDIAQECWYAIIGKLGNVQLRISFEAWAITIARRKSIDWIRDRQRSRNESRELEAEMKPQSSDFVADESTVRSLQVAIRQLPPTQRIVIEMFYLENLSLPEIGKVLEVAEGTVKSRLFYAREKLKCIVNP